MTDKTWSAPDAGEYPYTRGIYKTMYRGKLWTMRQYAGFGSAADTNRRLKDLVRRGQTGLSLAFDLPTQLGLNPDDPLAESEVGQTGVSVPSIHELSAVLRGIPLAETSLSMTINATAAALLAMLIVYAEQAGVSRKLLRGTTQNDILKEYAARNTYIFPPEPSVRFTVDVLEYACKELPGWHPISVSGYHIREAGATAAQEVGFTLSNGLAYVEQALQRGLSADEAASRFSFFFSSDRNFLEEIAKLRAARRVWARLMRERYGVSEPRAMQLRCHTQTAGSALSAAEPENNVVRVTLQALAAVLGGTQSLHTNAMDEALRLPSPGAAALALRTQQIIAYESGVADWVDPLAGSVAIETLTDRLEAESVSWIQKIDAQGGAITAVRNGFVQREIQRSAFRTYKAETSGERIVVGVNKHTSPVRPVTLNRLAHTVLRRKTTQVITPSWRTLLTERNAFEARRTLLRLQLQAERGRNVMEPMMEAVRCGNTIGEIHEALVQVFGRHEDNHEEGWIE